MEVYTHGQHQAITEIYVIICLTAQGIVILPARSVCIYTLMCMRLDARDTRSMAKPKQLIFI